jgi:hypothetical protein
VLRNSWWASRTRQFRSHLRASVRPQERLDLAAWTTPQQRRLFDSMHVADRRHGLDVVSCLRSQGVAEPDVLLAGLLHDAGKGATGVWPRVAWTLGERYGRWVWRVAGVLPGYAAAFARLRDHAATSASLATAAGCSPLTVDLIRHQSTPVDPRYGELLRLADEAN